MADFRAGQRIRIWDESLDSGNGKDVGIEQAYPLYHTITDTTKELDLVTIHSAYGATPVDIPVAGKYEVTPTTYDDGDAVPLLCDANGKLQVDINGGGISEYVDDSAGFTIGVSKVLANGFLADETTPDSVDEGDIGLARMTLDRKLLTRIVGATDANRWDINGSGEGLVSLENVDAGVVMPVSANSTANSETNPIYVNVTDTVAGTEIHSYDTTADVAKNGTDNHDYTVTVAKTFLLKSVICSASGAQKIEIQTGPVATLATVAVVFTSGAKPTEQVTFDPPIEVPDTSTGTVRLIRRNDDNQAMDVYSTIVGTEV